MKFSTLTATAALCVAVGFTAPALALDLSVGAGVDASASVGASSGDSDTSADLNADVGLDANVDASTGDGDDNDDGNNDGDNGNDNGGDVSTDAGANAGASASASASVDGDGDSDASAHADLALRLIALIESSSWDEDSLETMTDVSGAAAFDIDALLDAESRGAVDAAIEANIEEVEDLRVAIAANAEFSAWLQSEDSDAGDVVAIGTTAGGSLAVFTD